MTSILFKLQYTIIPLLSLKVAVLNNPSLLWMTHLNLAGIQELDHTNPESFYRAEKYVQSSIQFSIYLFNTYYTEDIYISSSFQPLISPFLLFNAFNSIKLIYHYSISVVGPATYWAIRILLPFASGVNDSPGRGGKYNRELIECTFLLSDITILFWDDFKHTDFTSMSPKFTFLD